jgi:hypothetical protein
LHVTPYALQLMLVSHTYIFEISPVEQGLDEPMVLSATLDRIVYYATRKVSPDIAVLFFLFSFATSIHGIKL